MSTYQTFEGAGFSMESNTRTAEQMAESLQDPKETKPEPVPAPVETLDDSGDGELPPAAVAAPAKADDRPKKQSPRDIQARIDTLTREARTAQRERDEIERRAQAAEEALARFRPAEPKVEPKDDKTGLPLLKDYESIEDHVLAVKQWDDARKDKRASEEKQAREESERAARQEVEVSKKFDSFKDRMATHLEKDADFWSRQNPAVVELRPFSSLSPEEKKKAGPLNALADHFLESENAPALIEYFSKNESEIQRFSALHPRPFLVELGKIEERLAAANPTATAPPPSSKAAPPARSVTGGPPIPTADPEKMSFSEFVKWQAAEDKRAAKARG